MRLLIFEKEDHFLHIPNFSNYENRMVYSFIMQQNKLIYKNPDLNFCVYLLNK